MAITLRWRRLDRELFATAGYDIKASTESIHDPMANKKEIKPALD